MSETKTPAAKLTRAEMRFRRWQSFRWSLLVIALLVMAKVWLEQTDLGIELERVTYRFLQDRLGETRRDPPVVVVDISDLEPEAWKEGNRWMRATSRDALEKLIQSLADAGVRGIGVDIDFSPREEKYVRPEDPQFFEFCQRIAKEKEIPVKLGVFRAQAKEPEHWLMEKRFADLASTIAIPNARRLPRWLRLGDNGTPLPSISAALALKPDEWLDDHHRWSWMLEALTIKHVGARLQAAEFLVDTSWIARLMDDRVVTYKAEGIDALRHKVEGRYVLLGDAEYGRAADVFNVAGFENPVPGVYLHACGVLTLAGHPLYELTHLARIGLDIVLSILVLGSFAGVCLYHETKKRPIPIDTHFLQTALTLAAVAFTCWGGYLMVSATRVLWTDFALVALALLLHSPAEHILSGSLRGAADWWRERLYREPKNDEEKNEPINYHGRCAGGDCGGRGGNSRLSRTRKRERDRARCGARRRPQRAARADAVIQTAEFRYAHRLVENREAIRDAVSGFSVAHRHSLWHGHPASRFHRQ